MDRPTKGFVDPHHRDPAPDKGAEPDRGEVWAEAVRAFQEMARKREADAAAEPAAIPAPRAPEPPSSGAPRAVDETLAALQALAHRYTAPVPPPDNVRPNAAKVAGHEYPTYENPAYGHPAYDNPAYGNRAYGSAARGADSYDDPAYEPPPADLDEPSPEARLLIRRSRRKSLALIVASAAILAFLLVGAMSLSRRLDRESSPGAGRAPAAPAATHEPAAPAAATASAGPVGTSVVAAVPSASVGTDLTAIERAMSDCDDQAASDHDALYFLIVPAVSPTRDYARWASISVGDIGTSITLLRSKDALDGLRDGSLAVYPSPYRFSIIDSASDVPHEWGPVTGAAKLVKLDAAAITGFRVRFNFAEFVGDTPSHFRFPREKGVCYWVSALVRM
jgi:hypothetical protein